jgi:pilus assembly protein CpaF
MCLEAGTSLTEERLLKNIVEAFPIMLFKMQLPDKSRKYMEVYEATGVKGGEVTGNTLYKFLVDHYERDTFGRLQKSSEVIIVGCISPVLAGRLLIGGVPQKGNLPLSEGVP